MTKLEELENRLKVLEEKAEAARAAGATEKQAEKLEEKKEKVKEKIAEAERELEKSDFLPAGAPLAEKISAKCSNCDTVFEFPENDNPQKCPGCNEKLDW